MPQFTPTKQILFIEDSIDYQDLMVEAFERLAIPYHLQIVTTGKDALSFIARKEPSFPFNYPDLIILDLDLPDIGGLEILKILKNDPLWKPVPCVIFTASTQALDIFNSYYLQANCYILKPRELDHFFDIVYQMIHFWLKIAISPSQYKDLNIVTRLD